MAEYRWSSHIHEHRGGLHGWCSHCRPEERHKAIRKTVEKSGYRTTVRRLNFLHNVANRRNNRQLRRVAEEDLHWTEREFGDDYSALLKE